MGEGKILVGAVTQGGGPPALRSGGPCPGLVCCCPFGAPETREVLLYWHQTPTFIPAASCHLYLFPPPYSSFITLAAARIVCSRSASEWAVERKPASNCEGAR